MISRRHCLVGLGAAALTALPMRPVVTQSAAPGIPGTGKKGVMLMNRIGPSSSDLYIASADGTGERKLLQDPLFEYNASFAPEGKGVCGGWKRGVVIEHGVQAQF